MCFYCVIFGWIQGVPTGPIFRRDKVAGGGGDGGSRWWCKGGAKVWCLASKKVKENERESREKLENEE
ncbi:unnamed protein product [Camellia sinensis]